jgi:hypothetical protein
LLAKNKNHRLRNPITERRVKTMENDKNYEIPGANKDRKKEEFKPLTLELNLVKSVEKNDNLEQDIKNNA